LVVLGSAYTGPSMNPANVSRYFFAFIYIIVFIVYVSVNLIFK
jgi:hypothetical protein